VLPLVAANQTSSGGFASWAPLPFRARLRVTTEKHAHFSTNALTHERMGQRGVTDLMSVSFSSNDSVGHTYGPESPQVRDITIRTDRIIG
jgi:hypothetical protein